MSRKYWAVMLSLCVCLSGCMKEELPNETETQAVTEPVTAEDVGLLEVSDEEFEKEFNLFRINGKEIALPMKGSEFDELTGLVNWEDPDGNLSPDDRIVTPMNSIKWYKTSEQDPAVRIGVDYFMDSDDEAYQYLQDARVGSIDIYYEDLGSLDVEFAGGLTFNSTIEDLCKVLGNGSSTDGKTMTFTRNAGRDISESLTVYVSAEGNVERITLYNYCELLYGGGEEE